MKRILITGGSGFIGRNLAELFAGEYEVSAPTRAELNLADSESVKKYFSVREFHAVLHCAIKPGHRNAKDPSGQLYDNTRMFFNLSAQEQRFGRLIFISSGMVYDRRFYQPKMREDYCGEHLPEDEGGLSKFVIAKHIEKSANMLELRPFGVYGKYEDCAIRFISNAICKVLCGLPISIRKNRRFDYIPVGDLASVIRHFIGHDAAFKAYNVTPDCAVELLEIAELVRKISGSKLPVRIAEPGLDVEYSGDNSRLKTEIPDLKLTSLEEGVRALYEWYKANPGAINRELLLCDKN